jgi:hypothetical protein
MKMKKTLNLIRNKETKAAIRELINLERQRLSSMGIANVLPVTFRGIVPSNGKEIIFEAVTFEEYYITIPGECKRQAIPAGEGQELLCTITEHWKPRVGWSNMVWIKEEKDKRIKKALLQGNPVQ